MGKHVRKAHAKKNYNYKNVKENKNMKNSKKLSEIESMMFVLQMQELTNTSEDMKKVVHEDLYGNLRVLLENEGFDMSFMDDPEIKPVVEEFCDFAKTMAENDDFRTEFDREEAHTAFALYLEGAGQDLIRISNAEPWQKRFILFFTFYSMFLMEHYEDRIGWIRFLAEVAENYANENMNSAYERIINYMSLFVFDLPSIELPRKLSDIVETEAKKMSA